MNQGKCQLIGPYTGKLVVLLFDVVSKTLVSQTKKPYVLLQGFVWVLPCGQNVHFLFSLEGNIKTTVPQFIEVGDFVVISTSDSSYIEKTKK